MIYDVIVIGGGPGGYVAAIKAAQLGGKVLLAEKENLGGVCLNKGCIPTKTLLKASGLYKSLKKAGQFGITIENASFDFGKMMKRKQEVVNTLVSGIKGLIKANGIELVNGEARIQDSSKVSINGMVYEARNIIVATGSRPVMPDIKGIKTGKVMDSDALLTMEDIPASMVIIGGGVIGVEFAVLLSELGCQVTILEMMDEILFMADGDVIKEARRILQSNGVNIITAAKVIEIAGDKVTYEKDGGKQQAEGQRVLMSVGRTPNTDRDELDRLGIKHDKGKIITDEKMQTNVSGIYAIGDVNGKFMLAHVASEEGIVAAENIFGHPARMDYNSIPQCIYSHPEIAWVGMSEKEAMAKGHEINIGKFPLAANGKSLAEGDTSGFIKIIADKKYNEILGVHIVCAHATDMISEGTLAISLEATAKEVASVVHPHPTVSEAVMEAALKTMGKAIHAL